MDKVIEAILSEAGLAGAFIVLLLLAVWKLYRDREKSREARIEDLKACEEKITKIGIKYEEKYRQAIHELDNTVKTVNSMMDKFLAYFSRER